MARRATFNDQFVVMETDLERNPECERKMRIHITQVDLLLPVVQFQYCATDK